MLNPLLCLSNRILDKSKITIGMCGQISERKNYKLFIKVSILYPNYNFMWIGDTIDNGNIANLTDYQILITIGRFTGSYLRSR